MYYHVIRDKRNRFIGEIIYPTGHPAAIEKGMSEATEFKFRKLRHLEDFFKANPKFKDKPFLVDNDGYHLFLMLEGMPPQ
jgi:hypothetical protein